MFVCVCERERGDMEEGGGVRDENTRRRPRRVGIFGLSANPPTNSRGHLGIVQALVNLFDELWVVPVYIHPFSPKRKKLEAFEHRLAMCKMCFETFGCGNGESNAKEGVETRARVKVLDIEKTLVDAAVAREDAAARTAAPASQETDGDAIATALHDALKMREPVMADETNGEVSGGGAGTSSSSSSSSTSSSAPTTSSTYRMGTVDVLESLKASNPDVLEWSLILGMDAYKDLVAGLWKDGDRLRANCNLIVVPRLHDADCARNTVDGDDEQQQQQQHGYHQHNYAQRALRGNMGMYDSMTSGVGRGALLLPIPGLSSISSTRVRGLAGGQEDEDELRKSVVGNVADYIIEKKLYGFGSETKD